MKNLKLYSILGLSALFVLSACKKDELTEDATPILTLSETTLTVSVEGGVVSVDYQIVNPVDGATVSVDLGSVTWITFDVTASTIELTVEANPEEVSRTATFTVSYPGAEDVDLTVVQEAAETPVLTVEPTTLTVSGKGGVYSVDYQVANPVDGVTLSVDLGSVTWITVDVTDSTIDLTVEANPEEESRTATLTVSYPDAEDVSLTVVQDIQYDYEHDLYDCVGSVYDEYSDYVGQNGEIMYYIWVSDLGFDDEGFTQVGGHYYNFALFVEEGLGKTLPTGTYTYASGRSGDYVISGYYSRYLEQGSSNYTSTYLNGGSITISADGDTYTIEGVVTDTNGATHRVYYNGPVTIWSETLYDTEFIATTAVATYYTLSGDVMNVDVMFTDMPYSEGSTTPPGSYVVLDTYMPYDENGKITPGTYEVNYTGAAYSIYPYYYSYAYNFETERNYSFGRIMSGTMTIVAGSQDDSYDISCEFKTNADATLKCTYSGYLVVDNMPESASGSSVSSSQDKRSAISKLIKQEMSTRSAETKVASPESRTDAVSKTLKMTK